MAELVVRAVQQSWSSGAGVVTGFSSNVGGWDSLIMAGASCLVLREISAEFGARNNSCRLCSLQYRRASRDLRKRIGVCVRKLLCLGIMLLGLRFSLTTLGMGGLYALPIVVACIVTALLWCNWMS